MAGPVFELLVRQRFIPFPEARVKHLRANAFEVWLPRTPATERRLRGALEAREIVASLDEIEANQALISAEDARGWTLTVLLP
ncbi:MAG: hypothetical protein EA397_12325 [Deltaproteobacteria bacterium]|nr:MAG: hypothetical protein EA397_12325 [Deltaproteobacteria bacterium]